MTEHSDRGILSAFGAAVRALRTKKGLSQEGLAALAGVHRTYMGDIERGTRNVALVNIVRIARALGISTSAMLLSMEEEMSSRQHLRAKRPEGK